jgi:hypothetical protein
MAREKITVYSGKLESGDLISKTQNYIDNKGSLVSYATSINNLYDKPPEDNTLKLVGQSLTNIQYVEKQPLNVRYCLNNETVFFENGSINFAYNTLTFSLVPSTKNIAEIIYGTGEYLGATGFVELDITEIKVDPCRKILLISSKITFIFTN